MRPPTTLVYFKAKSLLPGLCNNRPPPSPAIPVFSLRTREIDQCRPKLCTVGARDICLRSLRSLDAGRHHFCRAHAWETAPTWQCGSCAQEVLTPCVYRRSGQKQQQRQQQNQHQQQSEHQPPSGCYLSMFPAVVSLRSPTNDAPSIQSTNEMLRLDRGCPTPNARTSTQNYCFFLHSKQESLANRRNASLSDARSPKHGRRGHSPTSPPHCSENKKRRFTLPR